MRLRVRTLDASQDTMDNRHAKLAQDISFRTIPIYANRSARASDDTGRILAVGK